MSLKDTIKKRKPQWLKTTFWKKTLATGVLNLLYANKQIDCSNNDGLLITSTDGLGDAFLRLPLLKEWQKDNANIWILTQAISAPIFESCGFNTIVYTNKMRTNLTKRIKLIKQLNQLPIKEVYATEFSRSDNLVAYLKGYRVGLACTRIPERDTDLDKIIESDIYVGNSLKNLASATNITTDLTDNRAHLKRENSTNKNQVIIAVGAQDKIRMMRISNMADLIQSIIKMDNCEIILVGAGKREQTYVDKVMRSLESKISKEEQQRIIPKISTYSLFEIIQEIYQSKLLIGFDSGLYNLSYTLHQPTLCLAAEFEGALHRHASWVRIVQNKEEPIPYGIEDGYGSLVTNAVNLNEFEQAYQELITV